jgi:NDP-sugar pyrophosphorylase family protein
MKVIIPMGGMGNRFIDKGYVDPKPLIKVNNKRIIEYICDMFDDDDEYVFICNEKHLKDTDMSKIIKSIVPTAKIIAAPTNKKGPIFTMRSIDMDTYIKDDEEVIVSYCDNPYLWDYDSFKKWVALADSDGCILSHVGFHPHRLSPTYMAYIKGQNGVVDEIKEKQPYTDNPINEQASTGTYYFKKGEYVKKYFKETMDLDLNYNGEYYVTLVYNLLIRDGLKVNYYPTDYVTVFGTPEEVENFEAWQKLLNSTQIKSEEDIIKCYRYWKEYNKNGNT